MLAELRALLTRWLGKKLSYKGRVQLVDWVFQGKFGYLTQSNVVPQAALEAIQSITYRFICGTQKEVAWRSMIRAKSQGGMGVRDFKTTQLAAIVERVCRMWEGDGIWSSWMGKRYIKERPLQMIEQKQGDSMIWKITLRQKEQIAKCVTLGAQNTKAWIGKGTGNSIKNAAKTLAPEHPKDDLAKGIWANRIGKAALNLWRIRRKYLPTKDRLIKRGMVINGSCLLCNKQHETIDHLFFGCDFSRWVMKEAMEASGALVNMDIVSTLEDAARELSKVSDGSPAWGLQWSMLGNTLFHIWKQRNIRRVQGKSNSKQQVLRCCIEMTSIGFDERRFKRKCRTISEQRTLLQ